eukprot:scaffold94200_cov36-Phaeocystis_antarctica.AAC.1
MGGRASTYITQAAHHQPARKHEINEEALPRARPNVAPRIRQADPPVAQLLPFGAESRLVELLREVIKGRRGARLGRKQAGSPEDFFYQRQSTPQAALGSGQRRPNSRLGGSGRPYRAWFRHGARVEEAKELFKVSGEKERTPRARDLRQGG